MMILFCVFGNPIPKARPRVTRRGRAYTEKRTREWEATVAKTARLWIPEPLLGPVSVTLTFYRQDHRRADIDNLSKSVLDALNGIAYYDDKQVVDLHLRRYVDGDRPRVEIAIEPLRALS